MSNKNKTTHLAEYKAHQNYKERYPKNDDTPFSFALREVAHLVSPPKTEGEDHERRCEDIAEAILDMEKELVERWYDVFEKEVNIIYLKTLHYQTV